MKTLKPFILLAFLAINLTTHAQQVVLHAGSQTGGETSPKLHINPRWRECSFQLDPGLTQTEWREFTREAGAVVAFRPLMDAKPMGIRNFEVSILQWSSAIDESKDAWNDTFVHPDSTHWLVGGPRLPILGLTARMGITEKLDVGVYITKSPGANYGFFGAQAQYNVLNDTELKWNTSVRGSFIRMYGPDDLNLNVYSGEIVTSKEFVLHERWLTLAPYVVASVYLSTTHEKSGVVDLHDERTANVQGGAGVLAKIAFARLAVEYNLTTISTFSMKLGATF